MNPATTYGRGEWNGFTANTRHHQAKLTRRIKALYKLWAIEEELGILD